jgi:hypothetical protein
MRPRGILKKEILKSCASAEQRLLVENTTLPLRLSDEHRQGAGAFAPRPARQAGAVMQRLQNVLYG